ncbi:MAG: VOC family protein [Niastella sp.]|nr:VOC family protein [Niastella sp.]
MKKLDPYLNFNGNTEDVFRFYKSVFGGEFTALIRFSDMPGSDKMPEADKSKLFHVSLPIGDNILMGTDILESANQQVNMGDNFHLNVSLTSEAETRETFDRLSAGGVVIMPLAKEDWSQLFGMCKDKFGMQWMVRYDI